MLKLESYYRKSHASSHKIFRVKWFELSFSVTFVRLFISYFANEHFKNNL